MRKLFDWKQLENRRTGAVFTAAFAAMLLLLLLFHGQFYGWVTHGGGSEGKEGAPSPALETASDVLTQTFRPAFNGLETVSVRLDTGGTEPVDCTLRFTITNGDGLVLYREDVTSDRIENLCYYILNPTVPMHAWLRYTLTVTCPENPGGAAYHAFLSEGLEENGGLSFNGEPLESGLDLKFDYNHFYYKRYVPLLLLCAMGMAAAWLRRDLFRGPLTSGFVTLPVAALADLWMVELLSENRLFSMGAIPILTNLALIAALSFLLMALLNRSAAAGIATAALMLVLGLLNHYTLKYRGTVILPTDLYSIGTAARVAGNYDLRPDIPVFLCGILWLYLALLLCRTNVRCGKRGRLAGLGVGAILCVFSAMTAFHTGFLRKLDVEINLWDQTGRSKEIGFLQNGIGNLRFLKLDRPEDYSDEAAEEILAGTSATVEGSPEEPPDIVIIMAEALADLYHTGPLQTSEDYLPNLHRLAEEGTGGWCVMPVFGGGTSCSEFEFLTGCSMRFLEGGIAPYQQYIHRETEGLISEVTAQADYSAYAVHPAEANNWGRRDCYPLLGFDRFLSIESEEFEDAERMRSWITDRWLFSVMEPLIAAEGPSVLFSVTMQCHGGYTTADFASTVSLSGLSRAYSDVEQYLTCARETDAAIGELLDSLRDSAEPVIVLIFGDHLPALDEDFYAELTAGETDPVQAALGTYETPYLLWSNCGADFSAVPELVSINFLYPYVMEAAGLELSSYARFLYDLSQEYPVVSRSGIVDAEGALCDPGTDGACSSAIHEYELVQYNRLRGK